MQTPAALLGQVYDLILDIKTRAEDVEKLRELLEHLGDENVEDAFDKTKIMINSLCESILNIKNVFNSGYEAWADKKNKDNSECVNSESASITDDAQQQCSSPKDAALSTNETERNDTRGGDTDSESTKTEKVHINGLNNNEDDTRLSPNSTTSKDPLDAIEKDDDNTNDTNSMNQKKKPFGLIKVIDIKRLIDPSKVAIDEEKNGDKVKESDSDVVIISDTEDKRKKKKGTNKKNKRKRTSSDDSDISKKELCTSRTRRKQKLEELKDTFATFREKRNAVRKVNFKENSESDSSVDSDIIDSADLTNSKSKGKRKSKNTSVSTQKTKELCDMQSDKKYSWKAYVPLLRVKCEKLKEYYLNKLEDAEIDRLTNLTTLDKTSKHKNGGGGKTKKVKKKSDKSNKDDESKENTSEDSDSKCPNNDNDADHVSENKKSDKISTQENVEDVNLDDIQASPSCNDDETDDGSEKKEKTPKKKSKKKEEDAASSKSDEEEKDSDATDKSKKKWRKDPLLTSKLSDTDSDEQLTKYKKKLENPKKLKYRKIIGSDSEDENKKAESASSSDGSKSKNEDSESESEGAKTKKKTKRKRIRQVESSSDDEGDKKTRKNIRKVLANSSLSETTKIAQKEEAERKARIAERQKKYNSICDADYPTDAKVDEVVLDFDEKTNEKLLSVHLDIVKHLKPHQAAGIQFMWNACFESIKRAKKNKGSGCILAHCMGLGKTLQVIALTHTLLTNEEKTGIRKVLVVCPLNTVLNWIAEFKQWLPKEDEIELFELNSFKGNYERKYQAEEWHRCGGIFIISYDMFRNLTNADNRRIPKKIRNAFKECLVDPGPDLVVCDEGHLLKNEKTSISIAMNHLKTLRRIVLTGTPLQNNLKEYWCMVQFVKPNLLGTYKEYLNRFVNPITNGQYTDSTPHDIHIMRKRSHVLHKLLDGIVQRRDYSVLAPYLPPKYEYVLFLSLTEIQIKLYDHYMNEYARKPSDGEKIGKTSFLFADFQQFQRICTHPRVLLDKSNEEKIARDRQLPDEDSEGSLKDFIDDDEDEKSTTTSGSSSSEDDKSGDEAGSDKSKGSSKQKNVQMARLTRSNAALAGGIEQIEEQNKEEEPPEWWQQYIDETELDSLIHGTKLFLLFEILKQCEAIGDKVLVFSQSLYSLNIIEYFLNKIDEATQNDSSVNGFTGSWAKGLDYFRLDGSSSGENRSAWCKSFNSESNTRARLFLISTRAGGLGINLVAANRVVIFDVSWNPSHDIQSIYRIYRFGQKKPCYVYRFVMYGTMEMKIYERQVTKQAISKRVIDEQQIDRHYNQNDLAELYKFDRVPEERPTPLVPKDVLLAELLQNLPEHIFRYHEHQSLLENKEDEVLNEEERKAAWEEYETEKTARQQQQPTFFADQQMALMQNLPIPAIAEAFMSMLKKSKPDITPIHLNNAMSSLFTQLRLQLASGMTALYDKVIAELSILNMTQNQKYVDVCNYLIANRPQPTIPPFLYNQHLLYNPPNTNKPVSSSNDVIELLD